MITENPLIANQEEQKLIDAIKAKPGHQVWPARLGGGVMIAITRPNGVRQRSVWFGRKFTMETLKEIASA